MDRPRHPISVVHWMIPWLWSKVCRARLLRYVINRVQMCAVSLSCWWCLFRDNRELSNVFSSSQEHQTPDVEWVSSLGASIFDDHLSSLKLRNATHYRGPNQRSSGMWYDHSLQCMRAHRSTETGKHLASFLESYAFISFVATKATFLDRSFSIRPTGDHD